MREETAGPLRVFLCYSHSDSTLREEFLEAVAGLVRDRVIEIWFDRRIPPSEEWTSRIAGELDSADIFVLLVSPALVKSEYCVDVEMKRASELYGEGKLRVLPVVIRPYLWEGAWFRKFQALPTGARPVTEWKNRDKAFRNVAEGIAGLAKKITEERKTDESAPPKPGLCQRFQQIAQPPGSGTWPRNAALLLRWSCSDCWR